MNHFNKKDVVSVVTCKNYESQAYPLLLLRYQSSSDSLVVLCLLSVRLSASEVLYLARHTCSKFAFLVFMIFHFFSRVK